MAATQAYSFDMASFRAVEGDLRALGAALHTTAGGLQAASAAGNSPMLKKSSADVKSLSPSSYIADQLFKKIFSLSSLVLPVKLALNRENQDAALQQALGVDASGMAAFRAELTRLSQTIPLTEEQLADLARQGAQIGVNKTALGDFVRNAARLGVAFRLSSEEAGNALARFRQDFHLSNEKAALLGDALGKLGEGSRVSVGELFAFSAAFGKTAASYGVQGEQAGALGAALLQTGMDAEGASVAAGAAFQALGALTLDSKEAFTARQTLDSLGLSAEQTAAAFRDDALNGLMSFLRQVKASPDPMRALNAVFGANAPLMAELMHNLDGYAAALQTANSVSAYAGTTNAAFAHNVGKASAQFRLAANSVANLGVVFGTAFLPPFIFALNLVTPCVNALSAWIAHHETLTASIGIGLAVLLGFSVAVSVLKRVFGPLIGLWQSGGAVLQFLGQHGAACAQALRSNVPVMLEHARAGVVSGTSALRAGTIWLWQRGVMLAGAVATRGMAAAQWLLNAAFSNNPVGWVVKGIAVLAGAMAILYNTCEPVRAVFDAVFRGIGEAISWVWDKLNKLGSGFKAVAGWFGFGDGEEKSLASLEPEAPLLPATPLAAPEFPASTPLVPLQPALPGLTAPLSLPSTMQEDAAFPGMDSMSSLGGLPGSGMMSGMAAPAGAGGGPMSFQLNVSLNGMTDADFGRRVMDGLKRRQGELESLIASIVDEQRRLAYG